jgi:hypothetical protein
MMKLLGRKDVADEQALVEMREAPRFSLVMRSAKLLCETGEYVCVVRDISATGTKIKLFHEVPPDTHLYIELANGRRYAMERMWQKGDHAGFRFSAPIEVAEFVEETSEHARRQLRLGIQRTALITGGGKDWRAVLVNLSQQGACIEAGGEIPVGLQVRLEVPDLPLRFGHVCWRKQHSHGLVFQQSFRLDELARHAFELQPYAPRTYTDDKPKKRYA